MPGAAVDGREDAAPPYGDFCGYHWCARWALGRNWTPRSDGGSHPVTKNLSPCSPCSSLSVHLGQQVCKAQPKAVQSTRQRGVSELVLKVTQLTIPGASEGLGKTLFPWKEGQQKAWGPLTDMGRSSQRATEDIKATHTRHTSASGPLHVLSSALCSRTLRSEAHS